MIDELIKTRFEEVKAVLRKAADEGRLTFGEQEGVVDGLSACPLDILNEHFGPQFESAEDGYGRAYAFMVDYDEKVALEAPVPFTQDYMYEIAVEVMKQIWEIE